MNLAPEYGHTDTIVINREIAEFLIKQRQAFRDPSTRESN
jgi:hypothetical protein